MEKNKFINFGTEIKGDSTVTEYKDQCLALQVVWGGVSRIGADRVTGSHNAVGLAHVSDLNVLLYTGKQSSALVKKVLDGKNIDKVVITERKDQKSKERVYTLTNVVVTYYGPEGVVEGVNTERISLNFQKLKLEFFSADDKGVEKPAGEVEWDSTKLETTV